MARTTISIPDHLKAQMDEWEGVNWSGVAQVAFQKVIQHETAKNKLLEDGDMSAVVQRLRNSREEFDETLEDKIREQGVEAGAEWAKRRADYSQLASLAQTCDLQDADAAAEHFQTAIVGYGLSRDEIAAAIAEANMESPKQFWEFEIGLDGEDYLLAASNSTFRSGFVEGALAVWGEVADQI